MMKKLLLTIVLVIVIGGLAVWGLMVTGHTWRSGRLQKVTTKTIKLETVPRKVRLSLRTAQVTIQSGQRARVSLENVTDDQFTIQTGNTLTISQPDAASHRLEVGSSPRIVVTLPTPVKLADLDIFLLNGTLTLNHLTSQQLSIQQVNGTTRSTDLTLPRGGKFTKKNGQTSFNHLKSDGLTVDVKTGGVTINGHKSKNQQRYHEDGQYPFVINNQTGQVKISN